MNLGRFKIEDAVRRGRKAKFAVTGVTGSGKTFWMLKLAKALVGDPSKILVIDTELQGPKVGSAAQYVEHFGAFKHLVFEPPYNPVELTALLKEVGPQFSDGVVIVDSLSHFWLYEGGAIDRVNQAAKRMNTSNNFAGWKEVTPEQNKMVRAILEVPAHTLITIRQKMDYVIEKNEKGQSIPRKVGLAPIQRDDLAYELNVFAELNMDNELVISKSRCFDLGGQIYKKEDFDKFARIYKAWLDTAEEEPPAADPEPPKGLAEKDSRRLHAIAKEHRKNHDDIKATIKKLYKVESSKDLNWTEEMISKVEAELKKPAENPAPAPVTEGAA